MQASGSTERANWDKNQRFLRLAEIHNKISAGVKIGRMQAILVNFRVPSKSTDDASISFIDEWR